MAHGLEVLHAFEGFLDVVGAGVHQSEGGHVDVVILKVLQVEGFYVLGKWKGGCGYELRCSFE